MEEVIFQLVGNIALGLDGVTYSFFFKDYWEIVKIDLWVIKKKKIDLWNVVLQFFEIGKMNMKWKETQIVLISKIKNPLNPANYRPITLCKTVYKVVAKEILNRMVSIIPKLVSDEQAAFLKGRLMSEHVLVA